MKKWTGRGKRIGVPNKENTAYNWTPGTDDKYLSDILTSKLKYEQGWTLLALKEQKGAS